MLVLWKNGYILLRDFIGLRRNGKERRGKAGDRLLLHQSSRLGKRANALRSPELYFPQSTRVLCGKYSNALRKVLRRPPHGRARGSGPACGALRGMGCRVRHFGMCFPSKELVPGCLGFDFYRTSQGLSTSRVGFTVRTARFGAFPNSVFVRLVAVFLCRGCESASKCMP